MTLKIIAICEAVAAVVVVMIAVAVTAKMCKKRKDRIFDPYGMYAPITAAQLAEIDRAAQSQNAQGNAAKSRNAQDSAAQLRNAQAAENPQPLQNGQGE